MKLSTLWVYPQTARHLIDQFKCDSVRGQINGHISILDENGKDLLIVI